MHHAPVSTCIPSAQDRAFVALLGGYRPHGGISRVLGFSGGLLVHSQGQESDIGDLIEAGELFGFRWHHDFWLPLFQLDMPGNKVAIGPRRAVAELGPTFDGWGLASWFVQPNAGLDGHMPIERLSANLPDVLSAAREDRVVASHQGAPCKSA